MLVVASYCSRKPNSPVVVDPVIASEREKAAVQKERIVVQVTMPERENGVRGRLEIDTRVHFGEAFIEQRNLRVDDERRPRHRSKSKSIEDVRVFRLVERIIEVDVDEGLQLQPADGQIVAPGLQAVPHADAGDRPVIDRIDRGVLRKIDWVELGRRLDTVELKDRCRIDIRRRNIGEVCERLNDVTQAVEPEGAVLHIVPRSRDFEGTFDSCVENAAEDFTPVVERRARSRISRGVRERKFRRQRIGIWNKGRVSEILGATVVGFTKSDSGNDGEKTEISVRVSQLVERIDPKRAIVFEDRIRREIPLQLTDAGLAFVKNWAAEKSVAFDVESDLGQAFGGFEKSVELEPPDTPSGCRTDWFSLGRRCYPVRDRPEIDSGKKSWRRNPSLSLVTSTVASMSSLI